MKRFLFIPFVFLPLFSFAAGEVFDAARLATETVSAANELDEMVEQTGNMLRLFKLSEEQLKKFEDFKKKMEVVSDFVGSVEDLEKCYDLMDGTYDLLKRAEDVILDDDWLDLDSRLSYFNSILYTCQTNITFLEDMVTKYSSGSVFGGNMSDYQREVQKDEDFKIAQETVNSVSSSIDSYERSKASCDAFESDFKRAASAVVFDF